MYLEQTSLVQIFPVYIVHFLGLFVFPYKFYTLDTFYHFFGPNNKNNHRHVCRCRYRVSIQKIRSQSSTV